MKLIKVKSCGECPNSSSNPFYCFCKVMNDKVIDDISEIVEWCPLEDLK